MSIATSDPIVTIVSTDRDLLRHVSWLLATFGYQTAACCEFSDENPCRHDPRTRLLVFDARHAETVQQTIAASRSLAFAYRLAIASPVATTPALLEHADDILEYPIKTGELLTRLRSGVRRLEFESRLAAVRQSDSTTTLLSRADLGRVVDRSTGTAPPQTCVGFSIDFCQAIGRQFGQQMVDHLLAKLARCVAPWLEAGECAGQLQGGMIAVVLHRPLGDARTFAERVVAEFAAGDTMSQKSSLLPTLSALVDIWQPDMAVDAQLQRCTGLLEQVAAYGGNLVIEAAEIREHIADWRRDADAAVPFADIVARDVVEPFPMVITPDAAGDALRQWVVDHPLSVPCLPRIDESGALAGVVLCNAQHHTPSVEVQPTTLRADQPLDELFDVFNTNKIDYLVVVDAQQQPLGYISSECLGNLVFDQFDPARYRVAETSLGPLASLVVPVTPEVSPSGAALAT